MSPARPRNRRATERALLEAVGDLLSREGFASLGVNSVAREAGVDKVLIYRYFDGMAGLLRAFAASEGFWPSVEEILGEGSADLRTMTAADRWATGLVRYARALRRRPLAREVLAWEQVEKNDLTEILRLRREEWFEELLRLFPDDTAATAADPVGTALVIATSIHYLIARSRLHPDFNGLGIDTDADWSRIEEIVHALAHRTLRADDPAGNTTRSEHA
ncbi:TetR/AcrR family transcriptional regulator [Actinomadura sp. 7K507]|uniref:TetR/AcrR family transcriptional regulator n=1 Tax=Actinomadura sp. 7K507 TaxID=2530365 RepID=UPI0010483081|nr:TetR/AcrR family transcriptional regulator [Actinomadura sp. 7K507]TDC91058.1 TetR/AcrR family transcriptional regulator [Actinomadura sp. 7K507]